MLERSSGILLPLSSIPSNYGIGTLGKEAYNFIDFLHASKQKYWQLLPLGQVSYGDSPYASFSAFAGNPYYIDLELLIDEGLLSFNDCKNLNLDDDFIDYKKQFDLRYDILYKAYKNCRTEYCAEINKFKQDNHWVYDYSLFMALKYHFNQKPWHEWDEKIKNKNGQILYEYSSLLKDKIDFWCFLQFLFYEQYYKLKDYAKKMGVLIIGDMPIYVAEDSVEAWAERNLFIKDENNEISLVAGVPPDAFSHKGQLWGNPVYDWGYLQETFYEWWIKRLKWSLEMYDVVRIDHFRGFDEFWAVKRGSKDAIEGKWLPGRGRELFEAATKNIASLNIIAEDLGIITDSVVRLKDDFNFPGMNVLQFAFDGNSENPYLPKNYTENSVAYTGTHDNDTLLGWYTKLNDAEKSYVLRSLKIKEMKDECKIIHEMIKAVLDSKSWLAIIPLQDYLCLDSQARINTPSTLGGNWMWRLKKEMLAKDLSKKIESMAAKR